MELKKEELEQVSGGYNLTEIDGRYYHYTGKESQRDSKYVCPVCGRSVHYGSGWRYYCDFCDKSWNIMPNSSLYPKCRVLINAENNLNLLI